MILNNCKGTYGRRAEEEAFSRLSVSNKRVDLRRIGGLNLWEEPPAIEAFKNDEAGRSSTVGI